MKKALVVGGNSGIGLAIVCELLTRGISHVYIVGKTLPKQQDIPEKLQTIFSTHTSTLTWNAVSEDYSIFDDFQEIDGLFITIGFGRVTRFENLHECEISNLVKCNELSVIHIIRKYYKKIQSQEHFSTAVMVSIAGRIASPLFSVYGATKSALRFFIENINAELDEAGACNHILECSPGSVKGTAFSGGETDVAQIHMLASEIIDRAERGERLYIPQYDEIFKQVLKKYALDPILFARDSYQYKIQNDRLQNKPQLTVGYLSGTFDLFHIGHLNLLRRAKEQCDYLIVGVHESGAWKGKETFIPFEERMAIVKSIRYVDKVIKSYREDMDAWSEYHYHKLFVGDDYKGTERFRRYEEYFSDKGVEIVYFSYTKGTSSTQLRNVLSQSKNR